MDEFIKYVNSLPKALDKKEQEFLFYEYAKTKDPDIREKLISHNLRISADYALKYCREHNIMWKINEVNSDCIIALIGAIDTYDISCGVFTTYVYRAMSNYLLNRYVKESKDALFNTDETAILDKENDEVDNGLFAFLYDQTESNFTDEVAGNEFVNDIINYINSWENKNWSRIIKMECGLDGCKKYSREEMSQILHTQKNHIARVLPTCKNLIKRYIAEKYSSLYPDICKEVGKQKQFDTLEERNDYIIKRYFGIDCEQLTSSQISDELSMSKGAIYSLISRYKMTISEKEKYELKNPIRSRFWTDELKEKVFNAYYGLNGYEVHNPIEIVQLFDLAGVSNHACFRVICRIQDEKLSSGEITSEQLKSLNNKRKYELEKKRMEKYAYLYYSYHGLNGYEKKSLLSLSKEWGVGHPNIYKYVNQYEEYLNVQKEREKGE